MQIGRTLVFSSLFPIFYVVSAVDLPDRMLGSTEMTHDHSSTPTLTTTYSSTSRLREMRNPRIDETISSLRLDLTGFGTSFGGGPSASRARRHSYMDDESDDDQSETSTALSHRRRPWDTTGTSSESEDDLSERFTFPSRTQTRPNMDEWSSDSDDDEYQTFIALARRRINWETTGTSSESHGDDRSETFTSPSRRQRQLNMRHSSSEVVDHSASENQSCESGPLLFGFMPQSVLTQSLTQKKGTENKIFLQTGIEILESIPNNQPPIAMKKPPSQISDLKVLDENRSRCAICLEDYQPPKKNENGEWIFETIRQFGPCEHCYHPGCVQRLFEAQKRRVCPMCRSTQRIQ